MERFVKPHILRFRRMGFKKRAKRIAGNLIVLFLLTGIGVVFIYPILFMGVNSLKTVEDLVNPSVEWLPTALFFENYCRAFGVLDYGGTLAATAVMVAAASLFQTLSCALAGYAFARHRIPLKAMWMLLLIAVFLIPPQVTLIPQYALMSRYGLTGSVWSVLLPAAFGQGINSSIFVLVFMQFFSSYPVSFDEAAQIDGAGRLRVFLRVALPMSFPALVISVLFSFVWFWNETYTSQLLLGESLRTLPMKLESFVSAYAGMYTSAGQGSVNEGVRLAATLLVVSPLLLLYLFLQRYFIQGIESSGLTGE